MRPIELLAQMETETIERVWEGMLKKFPYRPKTMILDLMEEYIQESHTSQNPFRQVWLDWMARKRTVLWREHQEMMDRVDRCLSKLKKDMENERQN